MARTPPQTTVATKAIVAAGTPIPLVKGSRKISPLKSKSGDIAWQDEAWRYYDLVGEFRYAVDLAGNMISKAKLRIERLNEAGTSYEVMDSGPAHEALMEFYEGPTNHEVFLRNAAINLSIPGEFFTVSWKEGGQRMWRTVPREEITRVGEQVTLDGEKLPIEGTLLFRQWEPHPRKYANPNSPARALLPTLAEIHRLSEHVQAQVISRLASAGLFLISDTVDVSPPEGLVDQDKVASMSNGDAFVAHLTAAMESAIRDRSSASAVVPIVLTVPEDAIEKFRHITFWSDLDEHSQTMRDDAIRRLALGVDLPPEALTGTGDVSHWQAWLTDETAIKAHTQPLLGRITSGLTQAYLHPAIRDNVPHWGRYRIGADDSAMRIRPNRSKESIELYDRGELSADTMLRENGFDDDDKMGPEERREWLTKKVASGSTTPELVQAAIEAMGVFLNPNPPVIDAPTQQERPDRSLKDHPVRDFPEPDPALVAACDMLTLRALERAGNRIKNLVQTRPEGVMACEYYQYTPSTGQASNPDFLLTDAWSHVPALAEEYQVDPDRLTEALDTYTRQLIVNKAPRDKAVLRRYLSKLGEDRADAL